MCVVQITLGMPLHTDFSKKWPPDHLWRLRPTQTGRLVLQEGMPLLSGIIGCNGFAPKSNEERKELGIAPPYGVASSWVLHFRRRKEPDLGGGES